MKKKIKETKCTCKACGNIWYYGKQELRNNIYDSMDNFSDKLKNSRDELHNCGAETKNLSNDLMCCGGCFPAALIPKEQKIQTGHRPVKKTKDLKKCPKCNSSAVVKEQVIHEI